MIRMIWFMRYPDTVSVEEGDRWYLETHTQEVKQSQAFARYLTWKPLVIPTGMDMLGEDGKPVGVEGDPQPPWHRVTEMGFRDFDTWKARYEGRTSGYTPPPWEGPRWTTDRFERVVIADKPEYDLLAEVPRLG
jgi:hypothetical protein